MKRGTRITAFFMALLTAFIMPFSAYAYFTSKTIFNSKTYYHQDRFSGVPILQGIDVSNHNGDIDWAKVKASGVKFAIIRAGCRGYGSSGKIIADTKFTEYISAAAAQGLSIGIYFYSQSLNTTEAIAEANYVLKRINPYKDKIDMPIYYDIEFAEVSSGRLDSAWANKKINKNGMTENAKAFCNTIENAGYKAGIYSSKYFYYDVLNYSDLEDKYDIWLAHYITKTDYKGDFRIWQFTSEGTVNGIRGNVDANFLYDIDLYDIPKQAYTGKEIKPDVPVKYQNKTLIKGEDYYVTYANNINYGKASVTVTGINKYASMPKRIYYFEIVPSAAEGLTLVNRNAYSMEIKWDKHTDADGYQIKYYGANGETVAGETTETAYKVTGLYGGNWYYFTVAAVKNVGDKKYYGIESKKFRTVTKPAKPTGFKTSSRKPNNAVVSWNAQPNASHYVVLRYNYSTKKYEKIATTASTSILIDNIKTNSKFKIKVRGGLITEKGEETFGSNSKVYVNYSSPASPKLKSAKAVSKKKISANWKSVKGANGYQIQYSTTATFTANRKKVKAGNALSKTFKAKGGYNSYYVRVRSFTKHGGKTYYSPWGNAKHVYM